MNTPIYTNWKPAALRSSERNSVAWVYCDDPYTELEHIDNDESVTTLNYTKAPWDGWDVSGVYLGREFRLHLRSSSELDSTDY